MIDDTDFVRRIRRAIHRRPELGHNERRTAEFVERVLRHLGLAPFRPAPTSVAVVVGDHRIRPGLGIRAELDALPIHEEGQAPYRSRIPKVMHACGHDGHLAIVLTLARRLATRPPRRSALIICQQAEESHPSGAPLVRQGIPESLRPDEYLAFHLWPELSAGTLGLRGGPVLASVAGIAIEVTGDRGRPHGTGCEQGAADALAAGIRLYSEFSRRWSSRHPTPDRPSAVNMGRLVGGERPNQAAVRCVLSGTLRALSWGDEDDAARAMHRIATDIGTRTGTRIDVAVDSGIRPPVVNDPATIDRLSAACRQLGVRHQSYPEQPVGVSDDFGWYLDDARGALVFLGCADDRFHADLHTPMFDFDESTSLLPAVDIAEELVRSYA